MLHYFISVTSFPVCAMSCVCMSVLNGSSQEEVCVHDVRILPNFNASYLPMMPDGSVLLVDNVWYDLINLCVLSDIYF